MNVIGSNQIEHDVVRKPVPMFRHHALAAVLWLAFWPMEPAIAQAAKEAPATVPLPPVQGQAPPAAPQPPADTTLPPYEPQLDRLAELMGTLAYLRDLCGKGDRAEWRARMNDLLDAEATTGARRERLAGAYNRGFRGYETTYQACTPSAELVIARFLDEGERLTRELSSRYGGG